MQYNDGIDENKHVRSLTKQLCSGEIANCAHTSSPPIHGSEVFSIRAIPVFKVLCDTTQLYCHSIFEQKYITFSYMITRRKNYVAMRSPTERCCDEIANTIKRW